MKPIGVLLIIIGVVGIMWGGVTLIKDRDTAHLGPVDVVVTDKERVSIPPLVSVAALITGSVLVGLAITRRNSI